MSTKVLLSHHFRKVSMTLSLEFKAADMWIGIYAADHDIWLCLIPCFPIHIQWNV